MATLSLLHASPISAGDGILALLKRLVVSFAAALAPLFGAHREHLLIAAASVLVPAAVTLGWSVPCFRSLDWPRLALISFTEDSRWLEAQLRFRLGLP